MAGRRHIKDLLDVTEKAVLEKQYSSYRVATDQLRRCPEVMRSIADGFERITSRRIDAQRTQQTYLIAVIVVSFHSEKGSKSCVTISERVRHPHVPRKTNTRL